MVSKDSKKIWSKWNDVMMLVVVGIVIYAVYNTFIEYVVAVLIFFAGRYTQSKKSKTETKMAENVPEEGTPQDEDEEEQELTEKSASISDLEKSSDETDKDLSLEEIKKQGEELDKLTNDEEPKEEEKKGDS